MTVLRNRLVIGSTSLIDIVELQDSTTLEYLDGATVTCSLLNDRGRIVAGAEDMPCVQVPGGVDASIIYRAIVPADLLLHEGRRYTARATAIGPGGVREFNKTVPAVRG
jgi:hypothetical protein